MCHITWSFSVPQNLWLHHQDHQAFAASAMPVRIVKMSWSLRLTESQAMDAYDDRHSIALHVTA